MLPYRHRAWPLLASCRIALSAMGSAGQPFKSRLQKAFAALEVHDYFLARKHFRQQVKRHPAAAWYGLSVISGRANNPFYNEDSCHAFILRADAAFTLAADKERARIGKVGVDHAAIEAQRTHAFRLGWERAKSANTIAAYDRYINAYVQSPFEEEATRIRHRLAFLEAREANTAAGYEAFVQRYPNAREVFEARSRWNEAVFRESTAAGTIDAFKRFIADHPENPWVHQAEEQVYRLSTPGRSVPEYAAFIRDNPRNHKVDDAWRALYQQSTRDPAPPRSRVSFRSSRTIRSWRNWWRTTTPPACCRCRSVATAFGATSMRKATSASRRSSSGRSLSWAGRRWWARMEERAPSTGAAASWCQSSSMKWRMPLRAPAPWSAMASSAPWTGTGTWWCRCGSMTWVSSARVWPMPGATACTVTSTRAEKKSSPSPTHRRAPSATGWPWSSPTGISEPSMRKGTWCSLLATIGWEGFETGVSRVREDGRVGLANGFGELVVEARYEHIGPFRDSLALVEAKRCGYIDQRGRMRIPLEYEATDDVAGWGDFNAGLAEVQLAGKRCLINARNERVLACGYADIGPATGALVPVRKKAKWGYADRRGSLVIDNRYDQAFEMIDGHARVRMGDQFGLIDSTGKESVPPRYRALASAGHGLWLATGESGTGAIDGTGRLVLALQYDEVKLVRPELAQVERDGKLGYVRLSDGRVNSGRRKGRKRRESAQHVHVADELLGLRPILRAGAVTDLPDVHAIGHGLTIEGAIPGLVRMIEAGDALAPAVEDVHRVVAQRPVIHGAEDIVVAIVVRR